MTRAGALSPLVDLLGALGLLFVAVAVLRRGSLVGAGLFSLAAEYVVVEATGRTAATSIVAYTVALSLLAELVLWLGELPSAATADWGVVVDRLLVLAVMALAAALLALVALAAAGLRVAEAFEAALFGTAAAVALLALPWLLLRRQDGGKEEW